MSDNCITIQPSKCGAFLNKVTLLLYLQKWWYLWDESGRRANWSKKERVLRRNYVHGFWFFHDYCMFQYAHYTWRLIYPLSCLPHRCTGSIWPEGSILMTPSSSICRLVHGSVTARPTVFIQIALYVSAIGLGVVRKRYWEPDLWMVCGSRARLLNVMRLIHCVMHIRCYHMLSVLPHPDSSVNIACLILQIVQICQFGNCPPIVMNVNGLI